MEENENMMNKIDDVLKEYLNIGRKIPLQRVSLIQKGIQTKRFKKNQIIFLRSPSPRLQTCPSCV